MSTTQITAVDHMRDIGIFAHVDAGKTTASEAILYYTGRIHRVGRVDEGDTQLDWMKQERERGITITSAATTCSWQDHYINLIDTPGHIDFSAEVVRSMRVIDGAVMVLCGVGGVEAQSETVWMHADREQVPRLIFVNKLDRSGADFEQVVHDVREKLTPHAVALQMPIGREDGFNGMVDLLSREAFFWPDGSEEPVPGSIPPELSGRVDKARNALVESICETDETLLEQWLEGREPDQETLRHALRSAVIEGALIPVLCGAALKHIGIQPLLDAVVAYLPAPLDRYSRQDGTGIAEHDHMYDPDAPFCAAAFKIVQDPYVGHLTWVRVFFGLLNVGEAIHNARTGEKERVGRIYRIHADKREQIDHMAVGDVVALVGVKSAVTGDTLCDPAHPVTLETFTFPDPVIMVALTPVTDDERDRLHRAVSRLCNEDPTLVASYDPETGEQTLSGMGELHLEIAVDRLRTEFDVVPQVSRPLVAYRETVRRHAEAATTYKQQTGGHGHYARVRLKIEPVKRGEGVVFENASSAAEVPTEYIRPIERGVRETLERGIIGGYSVADVKITLLGGRFHEVDSSGKDFQIAGSMAIRQAVRQARPTLIEPVMSIEINASEAHLGPLTSDLSRRRGKIASMLPRGSMQVLSGEVPLAEAFGYATDLRSITHGRGTFTLELRHYDFVPEAIATEILEQRRLEGKVPDR